MNPAIAWCGARPIPGPGRDRAATFMGPHVMRLAASACFGFPGVVHTFAGVGTMGRVNKSVDGSLYPRRISLP